MIKNYFLLALKILRRKRLFTIVTLLGIITPVSFIIFISSFLISIDNNNPPKSNFKNVVYLDEVSWRVIDDSGKIERGSSNPPTYAFISDYVKPLKSAEIVSAVSYDPFNHGLTTIYGNGKSYEFTVKYTDSQFWDITDFTFLSGRPYNATEFIRGSKSIVIDDKISSFFFGNSDPIGKTLNINSSNYKIIGVVPKVDKRMHRIAANVYVPYSSLEGYLSESVYWNWSHALIKSKNGHEELNNDFQRSLAGVSFGKTEGYNNVKADLIQERFIDKIRNFAIQKFNYEGDVSTTFTVIVLLLFIFLIVLPAINLINININRVYERTSEIGIRKSFGATKKNLIGQFLFENTIVVFLGTFAAFLLCELAFYILNSIDLFNGIYLKISLVTVGISLISILFLSFLSGFFPSINMANTSIYHALSKSGIK